MNKIKKRKLFTQFFGMGTYDYYQCLRMKEAARLLREERLSVPKDGYEMDLENLSCKKQIQPALHDKTGTNEVALVYFCKRLLQPAVPASLPDAVGSLRRSRYRAGNFQHDLGLTCDAGIPMEYQVYFCGSDKWPGGERL